MTTPLVSVLIPAKDEEAWIGQCLASVVGQDYPHDLIEVIVVVDAASTDRTDVRAKAILEASDFARVEILRSAGGGTPGNLNVGLAAVGGAVVCRVDARSRIPSGYVRRCVGILDTRPDVAVVGGAQVAVASRDDETGLGIARALNNRFAMGWSRYRRGAASGAGDTVYLGSFRADDLRSVGGWSMDFATNQDFELNRRLRFRGLVWFEAGIPVEYVPRSSLRALYAQYARFGRWKVRYWRSTGDRPRPRQVVLLVGVPATALLGLAVLARSPRRAVVVGVATAGILALEAYGTQGPPARPRGRLTAVAAIGAVATGWLVGAWREVLRPSPRR
jgi:succinoglycan biosynthesis protein ExoA